jgi:hypothetical protein
MTDRQMTDAEIHAEALRMNVPGYVATFDWAAAEKMGAFEEQALSEADALAAAVPPDDDEGSR